MYKYHVNHLIEENFIMHMTESQKKSLASLQVKTIAYDPRMFDSLTRSDPGHPEYGVPSLGWHIYKREDTPELVEIILIPGSIAPE